jgi:signal transduction histidine kinase/CheY-like chemotaxis protein
MTRLHRLGSLYVREGDLEPVLMEIVDAAIALSGADFGNIQLLDPESSDLRIAAQRGFPGWWAEFWDRVSRGRGVCGTALERGERVIVEDVEQSPIFIGKPELEIQRRAGVRAVQSTPLVSRSGRFLGMFSTHWREPGGPDERALRLLDLLARHAADITERAQTERAIQTTVDRFHQVLSSMYSAVMIMSVDERVEFVNPAFCRLLHVEDAPADLVGITSLELLEKVKPGYARPAEESAHILQILRSGRPVKGEEVALREGRTCLRDFVPLTLGGKPAGRLWIHFDITERKRGEEVLREQDRRRAEFLAVLSHELRNPLAPIRSSIYLLERTPPGSEHATHAREVLRRQTDHLARLVDDLLDTTRIARGKIVLKQTRIDLREVARRTTEDLRAVFTHAGVALRVEDGGGPVWISADPTRMAQVLGNLLQNAVKFTPAGGSVTVTVAANDRAELRVRDDGVGMEPGAVARMFEPFAQAENTLERTKGGLGLGLPLVRGLVELHGGTVEAHSEGIGRGAEFVVSLPLAEAGPEAVPERPAAGEGKPREILVVEDNLDAGETLAEILALQGHRVHVARDGRSGLELARRHRPETVLCDIGLPDLDGYQVARELRRDPALRATRLVALTGYAQPEDLEAAREAGFDAHLAKPPEIDALLAALSSDGPAAG